MKRILCLSGGGARCASQIPVLKMLEEKSKAPLHEVYDMIIGTSAGAIHAGIIGTGAISMANLETYYKMFATNVFKKKRGFGLPIYDRKNFVDSFNEMCGVTSFGDMKTNVIITSTDLYSDTNVFYKSWKSNDSKVDVTDIISRSFAAPIYFGQIVDEDAMMVYSDGGVGNASLPITEAKLHAEVNGWYGGDNECEIHIIGSLYHTPLVDFKKVAHGNVFSQIFDMIKPFDGGFARKQSRLDQLRMIKYATENIPSLSYRYWDRPCPKKMYKLDGLEYIDKYIEIGNAMAKNPEHYSK